MNVRNDLVLAYMRTTTVEETGRIEIGRRDEPHVTIHVMECSSCGRTFEHVSGVYEFCPRCGRKVVGE